MVMEGYIWHIGCRDSCICKVVKVSEYVYEMC